MVPRSGHCVASVGKTARTVVLVSLGPPHFRHQRSPLVASIHVLSKEPSHQLCDAVAILL
jgi:hypothetical protein